MKIRFCESGYHMFIKVVYVLILLLNVSSIGADEISDLDVKTERVALFKNGLGYFTSMAKLPKDATNMKVSQLPIPSFGTFWVGYPDDVKMRALYTGMEDVGETIPAGSIVELLQSNIGKKVTITTNIQNMSAVEGTVVDIMQDNQSINLYDPYMRNNYHYAYQHQHYRSSPLAIIKTKSGNTVLNAESIIRADFEDDKITMQSPSLKKEPVIRMELEKPASGQEIGISYLARGITWSPSYLIDLSDPKNAGISAKAIVINEITDLHDIHLDLVTGFPNIKFGDINSPVAMSENLAGFLGSLKSGRSESVSGRGATTGQALMLNLSAPIPGGYESVPAPSYSTAQEGTISEDLFLYPVENFSLKKGETACIPLFTAEIPYEHIYTWEISDIFDENMVYQYDRDNDKTKTGEEIWHCCRMVNNMNMPWTTAAAEFVKDGQFTGQDICYYTAPGAKATIRINRALNIQAEQSELEINRKRSAASFYGRHYDLVSVRGEMKLLNRMNKTITIEVTKRLSGDVLSVTPDAKDIPTARGLRNVNPRHLLIWDIELEPGQEKEMMFTYEVYVFH